MKSSVAYEEAYYELHSHLVKIFPHHPHKLVLDWEICCELGSSKV